MTLLAFDNGVLIQEGIICVLVIKLILFQRDYFKASAFVVRMAFNAGICIFCMDTFFLPDPLCKFIMAIKTFIIRDSASKGMAFRASRDPVILCVHRRQLPGTD